MRNAEKDEREMAAKRELMLATGARLFAEESLESVSMQQVADTCGVSFATLYRYFNTKLVFAIAIFRRQWEDFLSEVNRDYNSIGGESLSAAEEFSFYLDCFIKLYKEHQDMLRFNQNFNMYIRHEGASEEQMKEVLSVIGRFSQKFHVMYVKALQDGTMKTDLTEDKLFASTVHIMLAACIRFAGGLLLTEEGDMTDELVMLKQMMTDRFTV